MDGEPASEIRFFSYSSRIGRVRYLAYAIGNFLLLLPFFVLATVFFTMKMLFLAGLLSLACYIFMITMTFVFTIRRLHDIDASGWWVLINAAGLVAGVANLLHLLPLSAIWIPALLGVAELILFLVLVFTPGTQGDNNYGPMPPPNSTWALVGAWSWILVPFLGGVLAAIAIPAYRDFTARMQMAEGIQLADKGVSMSVEHYRQNHAWPDNVETIYDQPDGAAGRYVNTVSVHTGAGGNFLVIATMKNMGVNSAVAGKSLVVWTEDRGYSWHCGPGGPDPVDMRYLPRDCRDHGAPQP